MAKLETECPNTFFLMPGFQSAFHPKNWVSQEYHLYLLCQHPPGPHPVGDGYSLRRPEEWWATVAPWLNYLIPFLKFAVPMGKAIGAVYDEGTVEKMKSQIGLLEQITKNLPPLPGLDSMKSLHSSDLVTDIRAVGPALRAFHNFLNDADPKKVWRGLHKTATPDGNILWLCGEHRRPYEPRPLELP